ncbi:RING finger protein 151 isoform 2-T2 [Discoglossus pictus]
MAVGGDMMAAGYDQDIFTEIPGPDLLCAICHGVLRCPVMIACNHIYCRKCILQWLKRQRTCPCCRSPVKRKMFVLMHKLRRQINRLQVKCPNEENGCLAHFPLLEFKEHAESCSFGLVSCPNEGCQAMVLRKDMFQHSQTCEHWRELCHMGCGTLLMPENRDNHNCYMELKENYTRQISKLRHKAKCMQHLSIQISRQIQLMSDSLQSEESSPTMEELE